MDCGKCGELRQLAKIKKLLYNVMYHHCNICLEDYLMDFSILDFLFTIHVLVHIATTKPTSTTIATNPPARVPTSIFLSVPLLPPFLSLAATFVAAMICSLLFCHWQQHLLPR
jgi:hypothetical protein